MSGNPAIMRRVLHTRTDKALGRQKLAETPQNV
ncbi:hypothetical protein E2C01_013766 [Portunus trituberculatus]|uniref:Uncharacterized protein n=1 Tax=Portunus trituberculatus TaxID=210409 RepID=A0A5B7DHH6_PORTR|nr:hypothetical protein [Portunus trituberculatus]